MDIKAQVEKIVAIVAAGGDPEAINKAVEAEVLAIVESAAHSVNPIVGWAADAFAPKIIGALFEGLTGLYSHIEAEIPSVLAEAKAEIDKLTRGVL